VATNKQVIEFQGKGVAKLKKQYSELESRTRKLEGATNRASKGLGGMVASLGLTTAALYGTMKAMSGVVSVGRNFEKNMSNVAAISGASGKELQALEKNARDLGSTTVFTASQVAELQTEFAKLGFSSKEIQGVTKDTLALASASGSDLATSAAVAGQTLRAFGLDVANTSRVTDTMAKSFSSSALDMDKFTNSMQYVAPVAKQVGLNVESTTAMLGTLANAGISGSMAGTSLRRILLELGNESSKLSEKIGFPVKSSEDLQKAFDKLSDAGLTTAQMKDLVGQRAISAFGILLDGVDSTDTLTESLNNAAGSAQEMAEVQLDNLDGSLTLLNSAMEGLGLRMFEFVDSPLRGTIDGLTEFTNNIDERTINAVSSFAVGVGGVTVAVKLYTTAVKIAKMQTVAFQATLSKTLWGAAVVGAGLVVGKIIELTGALKSSGDETDEFNGRMEDVAKTAKDTAKEIKDVNKELSTYDLLLYDLSQAPDEVFDDIMSSDKPIFLDQAKVAADLAASAMKKMKVELSGLADVAPVTTDASEVIGQSLQEMIAGKAEAINETLLGYQDLADSIMNLSDQYTSYEMQNIDNKRQKEINAVLASHKELEDQKKAEIKAILESSFNEETKRAKILAINQSYATREALSEEEKQASIQNIREKYAKQERDLNKAKKPLMIAEAIANTALGVTNALKTEGVLGIATGVLIAAAGALEVATIQAQEFASGGIVQGNPSLGDVVPVKATAGELILNQAQQENLAGGMGGITLNISAPLVDENILDVIIPAIEKAQQMDLA